MNIFVSNLLHEEACVVNNLSKGLVIGNRIPKDYFITSGTGESDIAVHAGSYHLALRNAGIEKANIMTYSSIMPGVANQVKKPERYTHGAVMETIMAVANGCAGDITTAGIIYGWLYDRFSGNKYGGLVCEHNGNYSVDELEYRLHASLNELYTNGFNEEFEMREKIIMKESFIPEKKYGTALVAICFTSYIYPIIEQ